MTLIEARGYLIQMWKDELHKKMEKSADFDKTKYSALAKINAAIDDYIQVREICKYICTKAVQA